MAKHSPHKVLICIICKWTKVHILFLPLSRASSRRRNASCPTMSMRYTRMQYVPQSKELRYAFMTATHYLKYKVISWSSLYQLTIFLSGELRCMSLRSSYGWVRGATCSRLLTGRLWTLGVKPRTFQLGSQDPNQGVSNWWPAGRINLALGAIWEKKKECIYFYEYIL